MIMEDKRDEYRLLMLIMPLARTPMDEKGASGVKEYSQSVEKVLDSLTPWLCTQMNRRTALREKRGKSGEIVVYLDGDNANNQLFEDACISK